MLGNFIFFTVLPLVFNFDCSLPKDSGEFCDQTPPSRQFYFDSRTKVCQPLQFNGCQGNENRFQTSQMCRDACQTRNSTKITDTSTTATTPNDPPFVPSGDRHDQWRKAEICGANYLIPNGKYILCQPSKPCPDHHSCVNGACCPTKDYVCSLRDENGSFENGIEDRPRFGWNHQIHSCVRFSYYGANGNYNNFPNFQSCIKYCQTSSKINT